MLLEAMGPLRMLKMIRYYPSAQLLLRAIQQSLEALTVLERCCCFAEPTRSTVPGGWGLVY